MCLQSTEITPDLNFPPTKHIANTEICVAHKYFLIINNRKITV